MKWSHHTRIKLRLLRQYLWACSKVHKNNPHKFTYFETHAGDGIAEFEDGIEDGSALIAASLSEENNIHFKIVLMEKNDEFYRKLSEKLRAFSNVTVLVGDSNRDIQLLLDEVPKYYHSLGFLDPTGPNDLKWDTVNSIIHHEHIYKEGNIRRPELLINFPLKRIKQNAGCLPKILEDERAKAFCIQNDKFFGTVEWRDVWLKYSSNSIKSRDELRNLYVQNFKGYYQYFYYVLVEEIESNAPLYYLLFFSNNQLADKIFKDLTERIKKWKKEEWIRMYYKIVPLEIFSSEETTLKKSTTQKRLFDF